MSGQPAGGTDDGRISPDRGHGNAPSRRRFKSGSRPRKGPRSAGTRPSQGPIGLARIDGESFELVHPRGVKDAELDYEEGLEIWKAGDPEAARDALRDALSACHDTLWAH